MALNTLPCAGKILRFYPRNPFTSYPSPTDDWVSSTTTVNQGSRHSGGSQETSSYEEV